jgi:NAD(P)-dependent dehydrogenase (short-subunit alcohol dehydrogenase family)
MKSKNLTKIINISARVGSIGDNKLGGWYSYRMSKAGLNMFTKTLSVEIKRYNSIVLSIHPGTTDTDLSKPFQKNINTNKLFTTEYSVNSMLNVINNATIDSTGKFLAYDGTEIEY